jgi:hypothetical protein
MPILMLKVSAAKSPHKGDPKGLEEFLRDAAERGGGRLVCVHSGGGGNVAYGIVEGPHDYDGLLTILSVVAAVVEVLISVVTD